MPRDVATPINEFLTASLSPTRRNLSLIWDCLKSLTGLSKIEFFFRRLRMKLENFGG